MQEEAQPLSPLAAERVWFGKQSPAVQSALRLYEQIFDDLYLRPADLELVIEIAICRDLLREALRNHPAEWRRAPELLGSSDPLSDIIRKLFGDQVPPSVALLALEAFLRDGEDSDAPEVAIGREARRRELERAAVGIPTHIWVIEIEQTGTMIVSVGRRADLRESTVGLVKVMDLR